MKIAFPVLLCALLGSAPSAQAATPITGMASWYGKSFARHRMADGTRFDPTDATIAANRTLPLGTNILVTNLKNGRSLLMRVRDRGPFARRRGKLIRQRVLDVSAHAAELLGFTGTAPVRIVPLSATNRAPSS